MYPHGFPFTPVCTDDCVGTGGTEVGACVGMAVGGMAVGLGIRTFVGIATFTSVFDGLLIGCAVGFPVGIGVATSTDEDATLPLVDVREYSHRCTEREG